MKTVFEVGKVLGFEYHGKVRHVRVEKVTKSAGNMFIGGHTILITGWDAMSDYPTGGYRSFKVDKIENLKVLA